MNSNSCWFEPVWKRKIELEEENRNRKGRNQTQAAAQLAHGPSLFFLFPPGPTDHTSPACPPFPHAAHQIASQARSAPPPSLWPSRAHGPPQPLPVTPGPTCQRLPALVPRSAARASPSAAASRARTPRASPARPAGPTRQRHPARAALARPHPFSSLTERAHASAPPPSSRNGCARHAAFPGEIPHARRARQGRRRPIRRVPSLFHTPHPHLRRQ